MFAFLLDFPTSHLCVEIAANAEQIYILVPEPGNLKIKTLFRIFTFCFYYLHPCAGARKPEQQDFH